MPKAEIDRLVREALRTDQLEQPTISVDSMVRDAVWGKPSKVEINRAARESFRRWAADNSTSSMELFTVYDQSIGSTIEFSKDTCNISASERAILEAGKPLTSSHPLSRRLRALPDGAFVLYKNPDMLQDAECMRRADKLAFSMAKAYPRVRILREPYTPDTGKKVKGVIDTEIDSANVVCITACDSFSVTQWRTIQNIKPALIELGLKADNFVEVRDGVRPSMRRERNQAVIVITGHINANLEKFIDSLGEAGVFSDNLVILNTCNQALTRKVVEKILDDYGAIGVFSFQGDAEGEIRASSIEEYLLDMANELRGKSKQNLYDLLKKVIMNKGLNGLWTVEEMRGLALKEGRVS